MMDKEAMRQSYQCDGFVNGGIILSPEEVAALADELDRTVAACFDGADNAMPHPPLACDLTEAAGDHLYQLNNLFEVSDSFRSLVSNPVLAERAAFVAGSSTLQV